MKSKSLLAAAVAATLSLAAAPSASESSAASRTSQAPATPDAVDVEDVLESAPEEFRERVQQRLSQGDGATAALGVPAPSPVFLSTGFVDSLGSLIDTSRDGEGSSCYVQHGGVFKSNPLIPIITVGTWDVWSESRCDGRMVFLSADLAMFHNGELVFLEDDKCFDCKHSALIDSFTCWNCRGVWQAFSSHELELYAPRVWKDLPPECNGEGTATARCNLESEAFVP